MEKAIQRGYYFRLGSGAARRSMVNASDIARCLPTILRAQGIYHLSDGLHRSYAEMDTWLASKHGKSIKKIPVWMGILAAKIGNSIPGFPLNTYRLQKLEQSLTFSDHKARTEINWPN
jgi:nucleoside-diphosphate-sugar epimerase